MVPAGQLGGTPGKSGCPTGTPGKSGVPRGTPGKSSVPRGTPGKVGVPRGTLGKQGRPTRKVPRPHLGLEHRVIGGGVICAPLLARCRPGDIGLFELAHPPNFQVWRGQHRATPPCKLEFLGVAAPGIRGVECVPSFQVFPAMFLASPFTSSHRQLHHHHRLHHQWHR